ncbi:hypothetical protein ACFVGY_33215, partial [Streptomyces sp. NPDC127106]
MAAGPVPAGPVVVVTVGVGAGDCDGDGVAVGLGAWDVAVGFADEGVCGVGTAEEGRREGAAEPDAAGAALWPGRAGPDCTAAGSEVPGSGAGSFPPVLVVPGSAGAGVDWVTGPLPDSSGSDGVIARPTTVPSTTAARTPAAASSTGLRRCRAGRGAGRGGMSAGGTGRVGAAGFGSSGKASSNTSDRLVGATLRRITGTAVVAAPVAGRAVVTASDADSAAVTASDAGGAAAAGRATVGDTDRAAGGGGRRRRGGRGGGLCVAGGGAGRAPAR